MLTSFVKSLFLIFMAEMGDKTQILAMTFATKFRVYEVLIGVFIGSFLNHGIAVALGNYLSNLIPLDKMQIAAGILFVGFAFWTLKEDEEEEEEEQKKNIGPILTVAVAFFIGELGDKTQLSAITLAVDSSHPIFVLLGTVSGMILTSGLAILIGSQIGDKIPEIFIKICSASIFMIFGVTKLYHTLPKSYINSVSVSIFFIVIGVCIYIVVKPMIKSKKEGILSVFKEAAITLYDHTHNIQESLEKICLGEKECGICEGRHCMIGYTKKLIKNIIQNESLPKEEIGILKESLNKNFDEGRVIDSLSAVLMYFHKSKEEEYEIDERIHQVRNMLEVILIGEFLEYKDMKSYLEKLKGKNEIIASKVEDRIYKNIE
ncbi:TMEM165/GDT1 family protein [Inediibacterium massiliense]|uniref:TMEM165/GDT1 family protein n=1 Tax=Inediibacterium massiliense TaxID=1658111 RepID=UPI0006B42332|nr:TMEM165/GDT1 family protein [Inediibacterium massiliense]